ncbi:MAG: helix-hairpin-helix domain-containing protein [Flavobacteriales bacterium]|nr:helix-hairpin-helix domain-containing protein [Flavobacteriales bacterium]
MKPANQWKEVLTLFKTERKAFLIVVFIVFGLLVFRSLIPDLFPHKPVDFSEFERKLALQDSLQMAMLNAHQKELEVVEIDPIDINNSRVEDWMRIGFSLKQSEVILKYRESIGGFDRKEDLLDVFIISDSDYFKIEPNLIFTQPDVKIEKVKSIKNDVEKKSEWSKRKWDTTWTKYEKISEDRKLEIIDINKSDSVDLLKIKGVGPYTASRILRYRRQLGGYYSAGQLREIRSIREENFETMEAQITVDTGVIKKINLNECEFKELLKHPYFDYYFTKKIFEYKDKNGKFTSLRDLKKIEFIDSVYFNRVRPYLTIE